DPKVLLIKRGNEPYKGMWAIPGGFVDMDETCEAAAVRELQEETAVTGIALTQFRTYSTVDRDPRHRTISVVYFAFIDEKDVAVQAGDDAAEAAWFSVNSLPPMAFDHEVIVKDLMSFVGNKL
ncbi:MAG: NUDIX hydrolase, partial [Marinilabiliales bacterium]